VKLDGNPVEGATVSFVSEDGKSTYSGQSDANGNFTIAGGADNKQGAPSGTYKVLVIKTPKYEGKMEPGSPEYFKQMEKSSPPKEGMPGMRPGMGGPGGRSPGVKSELPAIYASVSSTPLTVKIPLETNPVVIELKSKP